MSEKICLIIACYDGSREFGNDCAMNDMIAAHKHNLEKYEHKLEDVYFVISKDDWDGPLTEIKKEDGYTYLHRKNGGLSMGAWIDVIRTYKTQYDYYILCEDDYVFVQNNFDQLMLNGLKSSPPGTKYFSNWLSPSGLGSTIGILPSTYFEENNYFPFIPEGSKLDSTKVTMMGLIHKLFVGRQKCFTEKYTLFPYYGIGEFVRKEEGIFVYGWDGKTREGMEDQIILTCYQMLDDNYDLDTTKPLHILEDGKWVKSKK